jgi:LmbE family N-acetylglucosaminyl deacetylase
MLVFSPHFDDAALSIGGLLQQLPDRITVTTVFSRSNWAYNRVNPRQTDAVSALREQEERRALAALGVSRMRFLGHLEAPLRGYAFEDIFAAHDVYADEVLPTIAQSFDALVSELRPAIVLAPLGVGRHIITRRASADWTTGARPLL